MKKIFTRLSLLFFIVASISSSSMLFGQSYEFGFSTSLFYHNERNFENQYGLGYSSNFIKKIKLSEETNLNISLYITQFQLKENSYDRLELIDYSTNQLDTVNYTKKGGRFSNLTISLGLEQKLIIIKKIEARVIGDLGFGRNYYGQELTYRNNKLFEDHEKSVSNAMVGILGFKILIPLFNTKITLNSRVHATNELDSLVSRVFYSLGLGIEF